MAEETVSSTDLLVISRAQAKVLGKTYYFLGPEHPCKRGHIALRQVSNCVCVECSKMHVKRYKKKVPAKISRWAKNYYEAHKEKILKARISYYQLNKTRLMAGMKARYIENRESRIRSQKEYYRMNRNKIISRVREYHRINRRKISENRKSYYQINKHEFLIRHKEYYRKNSYKWRQYKGNRRARIMNATGSYTAEDIKRIYDMQRGRCAYCTVKVGKKYHVDHIVPLMLDGSNNPSNLQILCPPCNLKKGHKDPIDHMQSMGFLI